MKGTKSKKKILQILNENLYAYLHIIHNNKKKE